MAATVHTYNPKRVLLLLGGIPITGVAEDDFITVTPAADRVTSKVGGYGEIARSISPNMMHMVKIKLMQTSPSNDVLSGLAAADRLTCGGAAFPVLLQDLCGRTMLAATEGWVSKLPEAAFGTESGEREWEVTISEPTIYTIGGNQ